MTTTRRDVLRGTLGLSCGVALPSLLTATAARAGDAADGDDRVLVVLQLSGGNDGLATVVPYEDEALYRVRRATAVTQGEVPSWSKRDGLGFHPNLEALRPAWEAGRMAVVLGAGYPRPNRSHFQSMDIWHTASAEGRRVPTGWLGRAVDRCADGTSGPEVAVHVGQSLPYALEAEVHDAVSFRYAQAYRWMGRQRELEAFEALNAREGGAQQADWLHAKADAALASSARIRRAFARYRPKAEYPRGGRATLGQDLSLVSALIAGGLDTRVYYVETGGFDTHTGQRNRHDNLMRQLGDALAAFLQDLQGQGVADRVVVMAFSEFGRRVKENASGGTDHGTAGPMFLLGAPVRGGHHGEQPSLTRLDRNGDLVFTTDFRRVYATVLDGWLGVGSAEVLGARYEPLRLLTT